MADKLTAVLARVEHHRKRAEDHFAPGGVTAGGTAEEPESSLWALVHEDMPRVLVAVGALLDRHRPREVSVCGGPKPPVTFQVCSCGIAFPCPDYEVISRALLGEEVADDSRLHAQRGPAHPHDQALDAGWHPDRHLAP